jgi:hypothetical protein
MDVICIDIYLIVIEMLVSYNINCYIILIIILNYDNVLLDKALKHKIENKK